MRAISKEKCISDGKLGLQNLFEFVHENAESVQAYEMEKDIFRLAQSLCQQCNIILLKKGRVIWGQSLSLRTI